MALTLDRHGLHLHHRRHVLHGHVVTPPLPKPGKSGRNVIRRRAAGVEEGSQSGGALPHDKDEGEDGHQDDHGEQNQHDDQAQITVQTIV